MKDRKGGGKRSGDHASTPAIGATGPRKPKTKRSLTLAENRGLVGRDLVMSAPQESEWLGAQRFYFHVWDLQLGLWATVLRMSLLPGMLRQQAAITRLLFDVWLPKSNGHEKQDDSRQRRKRSATARQSGSRSTKSAVEEYQVEAGKEIF